MEPTVPLPYGPTMTRLLGPLHRGLGVLNRRVAVPLLRSGLGPLLATPATGSLLVLRTTGRTSGQVREAPLAYALIDGRIVVVAGYGRAAHWFRNALHDPRVEVVLPGAVLAGRAEEITDPEERREAVVTLMRSMGVIGRLTVGDVAHASTNRLEELASTLPTLAITPTAVLDGPYDPGGAVTRVNLATIGLETAVLIALILRSLRRR
ncbi:nitroreductase/quinone reductase family protein, partial [Actinotalea sp.]|uniref:nitroreductase/quinone reductase family protein n=1 Tax=Actinotalea sp. TaxID=1872145 RepID=UPI003565864D